MTTSLELEASSPSAARRLAGQKSGSGQRGRGMLRKRTEGERGEVNGAAARRQGPGLWGGVESKGLSERRAAGRAVRAA